MQPANNPLQATAEGAPERNNRRHGTTGDKQPGIEQPRENNPEQPRTDDGFPRPVAVDRQKQAIMLAQSLRRFKKRDGALVWVELAGVQSNFQSPAGSSRRPLHLGFIFNQRNAGDVSDPFGLLNPINPT